MKLTAFTIPILYDKTFLVIPRPGSSNKLRHQVVKVGEPFEPALWVLLLFVILVAALLSVWFTDQSKVADTIPSDKRETLERLKNPLQNKRIKKVYARLALDAFLEKGTNFVSAGVDNDASANLPTKFLVIGFGFFILITVSAYVANLAAFLTRNMSQVKSMESAVSSGWIICAHPVLESEFKTAWPDAKFYFTQTGNEFHGVLEDYSLKRCDAMAIGWEDTSMDEKFMEQICEMDLVITDSLIIEIAGTCTRFKSRIEGGRASFYFSSSYLLFGWLVWFYFYFFSLPFSISIFFFFYFSGSFRSLQIQIHSNSNPLDSCVPYKTRACVRLLLLDKSK